MRKKGEVGMKKDFIVRRSITMVEGKPHVETYSEQELVHCKDCTEYQEWNGGKICMRLGSYHGDVPPEWFCADGKKRCKAGE